MSQLFVRGLFDATTAGFVPPSGGGTTTFLRADGAWSGTGGSGAVVADADYGDVTVSGTGTVWTVNALPQSRITNLTTDLAALVPTARTLTGTTPIRIDGGASADLSANRTVSILDFTTALRGAVSASSAAANVLRGDNTWSTLAQLTAALNLFTSTLQGLVPASGGGTTNFLRADGTWAAPAVALAPFFDTVLNPAQIDFTTSLSSWNAGTLGQNTIIRYTVDSGSRNVPGLVGGSDGKIVLLMNTETSPSTETAFFLHLSGVASAGDQFNNAGASNQNGGTLGCVMYYYDGARSLWQHIGGTQ